MRWCIYIYYIYSIIYIYIYSIPFYSKFYSKFYSVLSIYRVKAHNMAAGAVPSTGCRCRSTKPKQKEKDGCEIPVDWWPSPNYLIFMCILDIIMYVWYIYICDYVYLWTMAHLLKLISKCSNPQNAKPRIRLGKREGLSFGEPWIGCIKWPMVI